MKLISYQLVFGRFTDFKSEKRWKFAKNQKKNPDKCDEKNFTFSI